MKRNARHRRPNKQFRFSAYAVLVSLIGLGILAWSTWQAPEPILIPQALLIALFVLLQVNFPMLIAGQEFNLVTVIGLAGALLFGLPTTSWGLLVGMLLGFATRPLWPRRLAPHAPILERGWLPAMYQAGLVILALGAASAAQYRLSGQADLLLQQDTTINRILVVSLGVFVIVHSLVWLIGSLLAERGGTELLRRDWRVLALVEVLPLPFIWIATLGNMGDKWALLLAAGTLPLIIAILVFGMSETRRSLERRILELSVLNQVSDTLRSSLNLQDLLQSTYQQINALMGVDNFYVALYDEATGRLRYPLAIKHGEEQHWPSRKMENRLTERVILGKEPIRYQVDGGSPTPGIDLPPSSESPTAWLGVPLNRNHDVIGCLCLFSFDPHADFTRPEIEMMSILSGQISVALDNSLLYEEARRRSVQLETFNRISATISASLDPEEVLSQVCQAVSQVGESKRSALFVLDLDQGQVWLAASYGLTAEFVEANQSYSLAETGHTSCLHRGEPDLIPDLHSVELHPGYQESLAKEHIKAFGDFPLVTPEGQIGYLTVFFDEIHPFADEEVELLKTLASVAAISVSNARLYVRTDQALENRVRQLAILEAVSRELAANLHSERLFELILSYAQEFTSSKWASIGLYDSNRETLELKASCGYLRELDTLPVGTGLAGKSIREQRIINSGDVRHEAGYLDRSGGAARSHLSIPLRFEERVLGVLTLEKPQIDAYQPNHEAFIGQLANQAAVAMVNAELYNEIQERLREQSSLYLVSTRLAGDLELDSVLRTIFRAIQAALSNPVLGMYVWDEERRVYELKPGLQDLTPVRLVQLETEAGRVRRESKMLLSTIPARDLGGIFQRLLEPVPVYLSEEQDIPEFLRRGWTGWQALFLPLVVHQQRLGLVVVYLPPRRPLLANELQLVSAIATQGAISVQNALLFADASRRRDQLAAVLDSVREGVMMVDSSGKVLLVNESTRRITGLLETELAGKTLAGLPVQVLERLGYSREACFELLRSLERNTALADARVTYRMAGVKDENYVERTTLPVYGSTARVNGLLIVLRDVTEEHQAAEARKLVTETLVHDLRSPLSAVVSALDVMQESSRGQTGDEILPQALVVARRGASRVLAMVESLLDISRMQTGMVELNTTSINMQTLVDSVLVDFMPQAQDYGIVAYNKVPPDLFACADLSKTSRILINLLDNALKFTPPGGAVTFGAEPWDGSMVAVHVSDTGPGVPPEFRDKIFDQFAQIPGQRSRRRGSGLGLTFCRLAVEAHGGGIWVDSHPGGGSTFTFTLPVSEEP